MKRFTVTLLAVALVGFLVAPAAHAWVGIGVNARSNNGELDPGETAGAPMYEQANWNNFVAGGDHEPSGPLVDHAGNTTSVTVNYDGDFYGGTTNADTSTPDGKLMKGFNRWNSHGREWITFSGLTAGDEWDVILYHVYTSGDAVTMEVGIDDDSGEAWHNVDWGLYSVDGYDDASADNAGTYTVYEDAVVKSDGTLRVGVGEVDKRPGFNAVQLATGPIPEPATLALLGLGGLGMLIRRKR